VSRRCPAALTCNSIEARCRHVNFEGWFKEGNGSGHFTFAPDRSFAAQLNAQGYGSPSDEQLLSLAMSDTGFALINELKAQGYERPTLDQLIDMGTTAWE